MEIEAKFRAPDEVFAAVRSLSDIGPFQLRPAPAPEIQHNIYYDTADQRLREARFGLRVRHIGPRQIATLKGKASFDDGLYTRSEWEIDVQGDDPRGWPAGELRERVLALAGDAELRPVVEIHTTRQHVYAARHGDPFAEISLDEGQIVAGERTEAIRELEIELKHGGDRADFDLLVQLLRERFALTPEPRSKLERAILLKEGRGAGTERP